MLITSVGIDKHRDKNYMIDCNNTEYIFEFFKTATLFYIDGKEIYAEPNSIILFSIYQARKFHSAEESMVNDYVCFLADTDEMEGFVFNKPIPVSNANFYHNLLLNIYEETYSENIYREETLNLLCKTLFMKIKESYYYHFYNGIQNKQKQDLINIRNNIRTYPQENWNVDQMAADYGLSSSRFYAVYKKTFGISPMAEVIRARINMSKRLLTITNNPINTIARYCGYNTVTHFINQFKAETGMLPSQYRKKSKNNTKT